MGFLGWYHISWEWHRKGPISFIAKVPMFHNQGKFQDAQNLEILEGSWGSCRLGSGDQSPRNGVEVDFISV